MARLHRIEALERGQTAQQHGGDVTAESKQGEGTCFSLILPLTGEK